jgi:hypothetical protein
MMSLILSAGVGGGTNEAVPALKIDVLARAIVAAAKKPVTIQYACVSVVVELVIAVANVILQKSFFSTFLLIMIKYSQLKNGLIERRSFVGRNIGQPLKELMGS